MKKTLLTLSIILASSLAAETYYLDINKIHYENSIIVQPATVTEPELPLDSTSCSTILNSQPTSESGNYTIDAGYDVYCDMVTAGGGWTLIITENNGVQQWSQFQTTSTGLPLTDDYRASSNTLTTDFTEILWYNHPNNEYTAFTQKDFTQLTLNNVPNTENSTFVFKPFEGQMPTGDPYFNMIGASSFTGGSSPMIILSDSDEFGDHSGGDNYGKAYNNWEGDLTSWYYRYGGTANGGIYQGNPWKENGHTAITSRLQSFFIR
jgi:hypothetical protein